MGLATTFHDPAIAIVNGDGEVIFAEATERYLQNKRAINCEPDQLFRIPEIIRAYCDPKAEFVVASTWSARFTRMPLWMSVASGLGLIKPASISRYAMDGLSTTLLFKRYQLYHLMLCVRSSFMKAGANLATVLRNEFGNRRVAFLHADHHLTHAATACYTSPYTAKAACMIVDGIGEEGSIAYYRYDDGDISLIHRHRGAESLGALFMLVTELCGFSSFKGEEWKVMGLAPNGKLDKEIYEQMKSIIRVSGCGLKYAPRGSIRDTVKRLEARKRTPDRSPLEAADLAHTWQRVFCELMDALLANFYERTRAENLILGGGCALNSSYSGTIVENTKFKRLHIPPAPADDGNALGAAWLAGRRYGLRLRPRSDVHSPYLGSSISSKALENLIRLGRFEKARSLPGTVHQEAARILAQGKIIGWVQGRAEFGPRALGNRSILADPRPVEMKDRLNAEVKFREEYRPFAPAILHEHGSEYFEDYQESPYMERTLKFRRDAIDKVPAVVHVDHTGRLQTVKKAWNEKFYALIEEFYKLTKIPLLLNTSFNVMGKPMIHSVEDAIGVFFTTGMDALVIEDFLIEK